MTNGTFETGKSAPRKRRTPNGTSGRVFRSSAASSEERRDEDGASNHARGSPKPAASGSALPEWSAESPTGTNVFAAYRTASVRAFAIRSGAGEEDERVLEIPDPGLAGDEEPLQDGPPHGEEDAERKGEAEERGPDPQGRGASVSRRPRARPPAEELPERDEARQDDGVLLREDGDGEEAEARRVGQRPQPPPSVRPEPEDRRAEDEQRRQELRPPDEARHRLDVDRDDAEEGRDATSDGPRGKPTPRSHEARTTVTPA